MSLNEMSNWFYHFGFFIFSYSTERSIFLTHICLASIKCSIQQSGKVWRKPGIEGHDVFASKAINHMRAWKTLMSTVVRSRMFSQSFSSSYYNYCNVAICTIWINVLLFKVGALELHKMYRHLFMTCWPIDVVN